MTDPLPLIQSHRPRSFKDRGVAAPFTTPLLSGARLRRLETTEPCASERAMSRQPPRPEPGSALERLRLPALDVVVPNPSGGRGVYILPWTDIAALCRPTMHDVVLGQSIGLPGGETPPSLTPTFVRAASRQVAAQGLAGRAAARTAVQAMADRERQVIATRFTLLMKLIAQTDPEGVAASPLHQDPPAEIESRGAVAMARLASHLQRPPAEMAAALDRLAECYADIGLGFASDDATLPRLLAGVDALRREMLDWAEPRAGGGDDHAGDHAESRLPPVPDPRHAMAVASTSELTARMASKPIADARGRIGDMPGLLRDMLHRPAETSEQLERGAWLLDGWDQIVTLWQATPSLLSRSDALRDISRMLPPLPDEAEAWLGLPPGTARSVFTRAGPDPMRIGRTGRDTVARNEHLRALAE